MVMMNPAESLYCFRESDHSGELLSSALETVRARDPQECNRLAKSIATLLKGSDQLAFYYAKNSHGVENASLLGYLDGCPHRAGY